MWFLGHSASLGCSKCLKSKCLKAFPGSAGNMKYRGFDHSTWAPRTNQMHRQDVKCILKCKSAKESEFGCRYSALVRLPYFDPLRMLTIDPMHNLYLGSGKHMLHLWLEHDLLSSSHIDSEAC